MTTGLDAAQYVSDYARTTRGIGWHTELPGHLSPSSLAMFQRCPRQYQERYVFGRKERPAEAPVVGSAVHAALEINYAQKILSKVDMPTAALLDQYSDEVFAAVLTEHQERAGEEIEWDSDGGEVEAKTRGRVMLATYHDEVSPRIHPISVEGVFSVDMGAPVPVEGRYDVLEERLCRDLKTGRRKQTKPKEAWRIQGAVYNHATGCPVEFHSLSATVNNAITIVTPLESEEMLINLTASELAAVRENVVFIAAKIALCMELYGRERPFPTLGRWHDWACSYCGFRSNCPAWEEE